MKLVIENLTKSYDKNNVLNEINYTFESGKIYGLLGRNGSGKTTLFNCINQDTKINSGKIYLDCDYGKNLITTNARIKILLKNGIETNYNTFNIINGKIDLEDIYIAYNLEEVEQLLKFNVMNYTL